MYKCILITMIHQRITVAYCSIITVAYCSIMANKIKYNCSKFLLHFLLCQNNFCDECTSYYVHYSSKTNVNHLIIYIKHFL